MIRQWKRYQWTPWRKVPTSQRGGTRKTSKKRHKLSFRRNSVDLARNKCSLMKAFPIVVLPLNCTKNGDVVQQLYPIWSCLLLREWDMHRVVPNGFDREFSSQENSSVDAIQKSSTIAVVRCSRDRAKDNIFGKLPVKMLLHKLSKCPLALLRETLFAKQL